MTNYEKWPSHSEKAPEQNQPEEHCEAPTPVARSPLRVEHPDQSHLMHDNAHQPSDEAEESEESEETSLEPAELNPGRHTTSHHLQNQMTPLSRPKRFARAMQMP